MELIAWFLIGAGAASILIAIAVVLPSWMAKIRRRKFQRYIEQVQNSVPEFIANQTREVSELSFRDKQGILNTVRIVVDPSMHDVLPGSYELQDMMDRGEAGTLEGLMAGHKISEEAASRVQEFVFSPIVVQRMRAAGMEPDEVVTKMLKASGRMA